MSKYDIFTTSLEDISILTYLNTHAASSLLDPWLCQKMHNIYDYVFILEMITCSRFVCRHLNTSCVFGWEKSNLKAGSLLKHEMKNVREF